MREFVPLYNRVLLRLSTQQGISAGGIFLPGHMVSNEGTVEAVGRDVETQYPDFKVGDRVLFDRAKAVGLSMEQPELLLVEDVDIQAVIRDGGN